MSIPTTGSICLYPQGSRIIGEASKVDTFGQTRLAVSFHRLIMPDGYSVTLDRFKGLDQEGATALRDKVNHHYAGIFGASIAIGILGGVAQLGTGSALDSNSSDRIREGFGTGMANSAAHILDRFLNLYPTVTIREGTRLKIYLSNDLLLPDYNTHTLLQICENKKENFDEKTLARPAYHAWPGACARNCTGPIWLRRRL